MTTVRTTHVSKGAHFMRLGEGHRIVDYYADVAEKFYGDLLAGPVHVSPDGQDASWELKAGGGSMGTQDDLDAVRQELDSANRHVDDVLHTMTCIQEQGSRGGYYHCSQSEYEKIFPDAAVPEPGRDGTIRLQADDFNQRRQILEQIRTSLRPDTLRENQIVRTADGYAIIGWGMVEFNPAARPEIIRSVPEQEEPTPQPDVGMASAAVAGAGGAALNETADEAFVGDVGDAGDTVAPTPSRRHRWPWVLLGLGLASLLLLLLLLWFWGDEGLPYDSRLELVGTDTPALPCLLDNEKGSIAIRRPFEKKPLTTIIDVWVQDTGTPGMEDDKGEGAEQDDEQPEDSTGDEIGTAGTVLPTGVVGFREGFRVYVEGTPPRTDEPAWVIEPQRVYRQAFSERDGRPVVGIDLYWPRDQRENTVVKGALQWYSQTASFQIAPGRTADELYFVKYEGPSVFYWLGVETDRPGRPHNLRMALRTPQRLFETGSAKPELFSLSGPNGTTKHFYAFMIPLSDIARLATQKRVDLVLENDLGQKSVKERVVEAAH